MLDNKNIGYIALLAIAGVLIYYFFFNKKEEPVGVHGFKKPSDKAKLVSDNPSPNQDLLDEIKKNKNAEKFQNVSSYVGPQDCAENCDTPYSRMVVYCNEKQNGSNECLKKASKMKQECLGKCDKSLPPYIDLTQEVATPLQENNYFSNLFKQGYV